MKSVFVVVLSLLLVAAIVVDGRGYPVFSEFQFFVPVPTSVLF